MRLGECFDQAGTHGHFVQFYKADEPLLNRNVGKFLWEGLLRGEGLLVIATPPRRESLVSHLRRLGVDVEIALRARQLTLLDAQETLDQFMVDGQPDWDHFRHVVGDALQSVIPRRDKLTIRAYGEMVGVLWQEGDCVAALRVEEYWNRLLHGGHVTLFCGYPIDVFDKEFEDPQIHAVLGAHTHCFAAGADGELDKAVSQAMQDVLGSNAEEVQLGMTAGLPCTGARVPEGEGRILWLRSQLPAEADGILTRARDYYEGSQAPPD